MINLWFFEHESIQAVIQDGPSLNRTIGPWLGELLPGTVATHVRSVVGGVVGLLGWEWMTCSSLLIGTSMPRRAAMPAATVAAPRAA